MGVVAAAAVVAVTEYFFDNGLRLWNEAFYHDLMGCVPLNFN